MKVLVTGATGFVGREIVAHLHAAGHEIHFFARRVDNASGYAIEMGYDGQSHCGDVLDPQSTGEACRGMEAVIHLVGIISEAGRNTFEAVHIEGTRNFVNGARAAGVRRFVHMSSLGTRAGAASRYHRSKWEAEEIVRNSGLDWTILRPSIIYGPRDSFVNLFAKMIKRSPIVPIIGNGLSRYQPVSVEAVAEAFVKALMEPRASARAFDLSGPETFSMNQIIDVILDVMRRKRLRVHVPIAVARIQAALLEFMFGNIFGKPPPLNRDQIIMLQEDNIGDGRPATELFGLRHGAFKDGIARYLNPTVKAGQVSMP